MHGGGACVTGGPHDRWVCMVEGVHGGGCAWQGKCVAGGVHGRGRAWQERRLKQRTVVSYWNAFLSTLLSLSNKNAIFRFILRNCVISMFHTIEQKPIPA